MGSWLLTKAATIDEQTNQEIPVGILNTNNDCIEDLIVTVNYNQNEFEVTWIALPKIEAKRVQVKCYGYSPRNAMVVEELHDTAFVESKVDAASLKIFYYDKIIWLFCENYDSI